MRWFLSPVLRDRERVRQMVAEGKTLAEIADASGCSPRSVRTALMRHGINYCAGRIPRMKRW